MNRFNYRFNFRVWFKNFKKYAKNNDLLLSENGKLLKFDTVGCYPEKDIVIEQCTGLEDKNGNLIYEGDVIYSEIRKETRFVVWDNDLASFTFTDEYGYRYCGFCKSSILGNEFEIINNVHNYKNKLQQTVEQRLERYIDDECYDNRWEGFQSTLDMLKDRYIEILENDNELVEEILEESHVEVNDENKKLVIEFAKEA